MKNIHILPTPNPSRLHEYDYLSPMGLSKEPLQWRLGRNIYITNNEEIKEGDWFFDIVLNKPFKCESERHAFDLYHTDNAKKIILTTDPQLIKDGVQAIDDAFLEWFVKNPSCESVEVESFCKNGDNCPSKGAYDKQHLCNVGYEIIIPKEENIYDEYLKDELKKYKDIKTIVFDKPKQETLEEVATRLYPIILEDDGWDKNKQYRDEWVNGVKYQQEQERSYSEEEVLPIVEYIQWVIRKVDRGDTPEEIVRLLLFNRDKIEQFKKK